MVNYQEQFDEWLSVIPQFSFAWYKNSEMARKNKYKTIEVLKNYFPEDKDKQKLKEKLLNKVEKTNLREIR